MRTGILIAIEFGLYAREVLPSLPQVATHLALVCIDLVFLRVLRRHSEFTEIYAAFVEVLLHYRRFIYILLYFLYHQERQGKA